MSNDNSCELRLQKDSLLQSGYGFAINKHFKWSSNINQALHRYRESTELMGIYRKWFSNVCAETTTKPTIAQLTINHFGGLVFILFLTAGLCIPAIIPEHLFEKYLENKMTMYIKNFFKRRNNQRSKIHIVPPHYQNEVYRMKRLTNGDMAFANKNYDNGDVT